MLTFRCTRGLHWFSLRLWLVSERWSNRHTNAPIQWLKILNRRQNLWAQTVWFRILLPIGIFCGDQHSMKHATFWHRNSEETMHSKKETRQHRNSIPFWNGNKRAAQQSTYIKIRRKKLIETLYVNKRDCDMQFCIIIVMCDYSCSHRDLAMCVI